MLNPNVLKSVLPAMALMVLLGSADAALAQDTAARVDFAIGGVSATAVGGVARPLAKGDLVFSGDTINTDSTGRTQIHFTDGAYMSLQPQTQFRVDNYRYEGAADGKEKGFFSLLKGGMRTITGVIGHTNRNTYQVNTPVATIGIRGTEYLANLVDGLELSIGNGSIFVLNNSGKFVLEQGQSAFIANQNAVPVLTVNPPSLPPAPVLQNSKPPSDTPTFLAGSQVNSSGSAAIGGGGGFGVALPFGPGYALAISQGSRSDTPGFDCAGGFSPCGQPIVTLSSSGATWVQATQSVLFDPGVISGGAGTATVTSSSAGGVIGWGSFTNGTFITTNKVQTFGPNEGIHFVIGIPTSPMPTSGTATMSLIGATMPTFSDNAGGGLGTGTVTGGSLHANFAPGVSVITSTNFNVAFSSGNTYLFNGSGGGLGSGIIGAGNFSKIGGASPICAASCTGVFNGFFAGSGATYAGYTYLISGPMPFYINGATVFH